MNSTIVSTIVIECPNCATKYKVIEEAVRPRGRTVHCTQCQNKWHVEPTISAIDEWEERFKPDPVAEPVHEPEEAEGEHPPYVQEELAGPSERFPAPSQAENIVPDSTFMVAAPKIESEPDTSGPKKASLGLLVASLVVLAGLGFALRGPIEHAWPASARLYQTVGIEKMTVPGQGLELKDARAYLVTDAAGMQTLTIEAKVLNPQKTALAVPSLTATLASANGGAARHWTFDAGTQKLDPEATASAKASFDGANTENGKILLTFSADNEGGSK